MTNKLANRIQLMGDLLPGNREVIKMATDFVADEMGVKLERLLTMRKQHPVPTARAAIVAIVSRDAPMVSHPMLARLFGGDQSTYSYVRTKVLNNDLRDGYLAQFDEWRAKRLDTPTDAVPQCTDEVDGLALECEVLPNSET